MKFILYIQFDKVYDIIIKLVNKCLLFRVIGGLNSLSLDKENPVSTEQTDSKETNAEQENLNEKVKQEQQKPKQIQNEVYTVRITPDKTGDVKLFTVTRSMLRYIIASSVVLFILVVGSLSFAGYAYFTNQNDKAHIRQLQDANSLQQQQLSDLDKRAKKLQDQMDELNNLENELKQISGISDDNSASDENSDDSEGDAVNPDQNGQGGPYPEKVTINSVKTILDNVENRMNGKRDNMANLKLQLQKAIVMKRAANYSGMGAVSGVSSVVPSIWPTAGTVSSPFGLRWGGSDFHPGIDIANDIGTPIRATADGVVSVAGWNSGGYGNMVDIDHGNGIMTRYGHASYVVVTPGQYVRRGQIIAYMGSTGYSTGPHLHYEVRVHGQAVDPSGYLLN